MGGLTILLLLLCCSSHLVVVSSTFAYRTLTFVNQCNERIRVGRTGGRCLQRDNITYPSTGCPTQMNLNPNDNYCYWDILGFGNGPDLQPGANISYNLPGEEFVCGPGLNPTIWSGNVWGATGCNDTAACETAICYYGANNPRNGYCTAYQGPKGPYTSAEFTFQSDFDTYDVTTISGVNVPMEMKPIGVTPPASSSPPSSYYWCGNAGGVTPSNLSLSGCSWMYNFTSISGADFSVISTLVAKSDNNTGCEDDSDCPSGEVCGTLEELDSSGGPGTRLFPQRCGRLIGLWTADGICAWSKGFDTPTEFPNNLPLRCKTNTGQGSGRFSDLYQCTAQYATSGYSVGVCDPMVTCGCPEWRDSGINAPPTTTCQCNNPVWQNNSLPWLEPFKRACPTSYTFPFDDSSSTFTCNDGTPSNTQGYTITFCPEGRQVSRAPTFEVEDGSGAGIVVCSTGITVAVLMLGLIAITLLG